MKRISSIALMGMLFVFVVGCAAYGPAVVPNGVIRSVDITGKGDVAEYRVYTAYGADKNGMNTASTLVIRETPSLGDKPATSALAYAQTAAQTGINKALVEQIIPAVATVAQGTVPGILIANAYRDSADTLGKAGIDAARVQGLESAKMLTDPSNPANMPSTTNFFNSNYQQQLQNQYQRQRQGFVGVNIQ